jgi:hypothetical protein
MDDTDMHAHGWHGDSHIHTRTYILDRGVQLLEVIGHKQSEKHDTSPPEPVAYFNDTPSRTQNVQKAYDLSSQPENARGWPLENLSSWPSDRWWNNHSEQSTYVWASYQSVYITISRRVRMQNADHRHEYPECPVRHQLDLKNWTTKEIYYEMRHVATIKFKSRLNSLRWKCC